MIIKAKKGEIRLDDNIDELPMDRMMIFNENAMLALNIGNTPGDVDRHLANFDRHVFHGKMAEARTIAENLRKTYYNMIEKVDYTYLMFAVLVNSISGEEITDYTDDGLHSTVNKLKGTEVTHGQIKGAVEIIKKKFWIN